MKNATRYCAGPAYYRMCSTDVYCSKQTGSSSTKTITHHFFVSDWAKKTVDAAKICSDLEMLLKRNQQTFVNGLLGFITRHLYSRWKRIVYCSQLHELPIDMGALSALLINILLGSFQLFLHGDQPLCGAEIIPFSGVCQSGGGCIIHAGGGGSFTDWQTALMCNRRRPAAASSRRASFSAPASANSFVCCIWL